MRLIDADDLKDRFEAAIVPDAYKPSYSIAEILVEIDHAPTVDAVPVVRCKDCRWAYDQGPSGVYCAHHDCRNPLSCLPEEFCNRGEKR